MSDLRSTKSGPGWKSAGRFRGGADVRTIGPFRGATQQGFGDRIRSRWLSFGARTFKPIRLSFRRPGKFPELARLPRARRTDPVRYVFSPTFQLTFPFSPVNNLFFEANTDSRFRWLVAEMNRPGPAGAPPAGVTSAGGTPAGGTPPAGATPAVVAPAPGSHAGVFRHSLLQFRNYRVGPGPIQPKGAAGKGDLVLLREGRSAGALAVGRRSWAGTPRGETSRGAPARPSFTILRTAQRWVQILSESLGRSGREGGPPRGGGGGVRETEKILVLLRPVLERGGAAAAGASSHATFSHATFSHATLKTVETVNAVALRQSFFTRLTLHTHGAGPAASPGGAFAAPSITFAAPSISFAAPTITFAAPPRPAGAARRDTGYVPPVALSYARREPAAQLQAVVSALRDLRHQPPSEARAPAAPQLPTIEQLATQVSRQLERELRIEKERRGL